MSSRGTKHFHHSWQYSWTPRADVNSAKAPLNRALAHTHTHTHTHTHKRSSASVQSPTDTRFSRADRSAASRRPTSRWYAATVDRFSCTRTARGHDGSITMEEKKLRSSIGGTKHSPPPLPAVCLRRQRAPQGRPALAPAQRCTQCEPGSPGWLACASQLVQPRLVEQGSTVLSPL